MTRPSLVLTAALGLIATDIAAQSEMDTDGDGLVSRSEMSTAMPDLTEETFVMIDTNGDGMVDPSELAAARDAGLLPMEIRAPDDRSRP